jgi:enoyl-CoA hydratase/carnithine racemase
MSPLECYDFANTYGQKLYHRLEELDIPVIAMINGLCLGGGCEVALAVTSDRLGQRQVRQPEILLGMIPGSGATQRLPVSSDRAWLGS